ncbi:MAG: hypothetical protein EOP62_21545 [Sphingomonadales bacterium]|nr:MAG: hypothetical protein EOP62_21545 [Sphingomonadales bacterium]
MNVPAVRMNARAPIQPDLTDAELRALAYFAVGVSSEGSKAGRDVSNRLSFAGNIPNGVMMPVGNSGFSIGTLQIDLGQRPAVARSLTDAYQAWATSEHPDWRLSEAQYAQTVRDLSRNGRAITADQGRPLDAMVKQHLDQFLHSGDGIRFVHEHDVNQVNQLMNGIVRNVRQTPLYQQSGLDERAELITMMVKLQNQSDNRWAPRLVRSMTNGEYENVGDVSRAIDGLRAPSGASDYIESGRNHAVSGAHVFNALRRMEDTNPLYDAWRNILDNPLVDPTRLNADMARPNLVAEYATIKTLFLQHGQALDFIDSMERGAGYAYGRPRPEGRGAATAGLYSSGDDFIVWSLDGVGHARINDSWSPIERDDLSRVRNRDGSVDLSIDQNGLAVPLMHADPRAAPLRPTPQRRAEIEYLDHALPLGVRFAYQEPSSEDPMVARVLDDLPHGSVRPADPASHSPVEFLLPQAERAVRQLEQGRGRQYDDQSACMAASVACMAKANGLSQIDHVLLSEARGAMGQGENLFVIQGDPGDPAHRRAVMKAHDAIAMPVEQSVAQLQRLNDGLQGQSPAQALDERAREVGTAPMRLG